jgi:Ca-activated chloride channel homolog
MKMTSIALLVTLTVAAPPSAPSQTRPRRAEPQTSNPAPTRSEPPPTGEPASAHESQEVGADDVVRIETTLVTVPVSVMDRDGRYVADLRKEDFHVYENGVEQPVAYFAAVDKPFTVVLTLDTSASTWSKLSQIKEAALAFVEQLRPEDQVMVTSFARGFTVKCRPTTDRQKIRDAIEGTGKGLSTHLYDAMERLMGKELAGVEGRKAVVLFTDGVDAVSHHATYEGTVSLAEELDALIYPIRYDTYDPAADNGGTRPAPTQTRSRLPSILRRLPLPTIGVGGGGSGGGSNGSSRADYERGERYLHDLAELTGGRVYEASRDLSLLRAAFSHIAEELRRQYSIGYYPRRPARAGERLQIKVRVDRPEVAVRARGSYVFSGTAAGATAPSSSAKDKERAPAPPVLQKKPFDGRL